MGFLGVYRAVYDYVPQGETELAITEGDLLYVLEKSKEDDWWKAKKKAAADDDDEPTGLVPNNYVEEVCYVVWMFDDIGHCCPFHVFIKSSNATLSIMRSSQKYAGLQLLIVTLGATN